MRTSLQRNHNDQMLCAVLCCVLFFRILFLCLGGAKIYMISLVKTQTHTHTHTHSLCLVYTQLQCTL